MTKLKIMLLVAILIAGGSRTAKAQADESAQLALNIEKLAQFKQILKDLKSGYQIISKGYGTIKDISQGNFNLHKTFLDGLYAVSPEVRKYRKVAEIIDYQIVLVKEYKAALSDFRGSDLLSVKEVSYLGNVYDQLFKSSLKNLDELTMILTASQLRMTDDERLNAIDAIHADMEDKVMFLRYFNNENSLLLMQREKEKNDIKNIQKMQGIK